MPDPSALLFVLFVGVFLPVMAWRSSRRFHAAAGQGLRITRRQFYVSAFTTQIVTLVLALLVAWRVGIELPGPFSVQPLAWIVTAALVAALLATMPWRWRTRSPEQKRRQAMFAPRSPPEYAANIALCLLAGIGEELVYRGVMHACLWYWTGSWTIATVFCSLSFGVAHALQGRRAMLIVTGIAAWMHATVLWTGSLHVAMAAHAVYDLITTFTIAAWVRRDPEALEPPGSQAA